MTSVAGQPENTLGVRHDVQLAGSVPSNETGTSEITTLKARESRDPATFVPHHARQTAARFVNRFKTGVSI